MAEFNEWILPFIDLEDLEVERMEEMLEKLIVLQSVPGLEWDTERKQIRDAQDNLRMRIHKAKQTLVYAFRDDKP